MGSDKETFHFELSLEGAQMGYEPGDSLGVIPKNCPEVLGDVLAAAGFSGEETASAIGEEKTLGQVLLTDYSVTQLTPSLLKRYAVLAGSE